MISLTICVTGLALASPTQRLSSGLEWKANEGWQVNIMEQGAMMQAPGHDASNEAYVVGLFQEIRSLDDSSRMPEYIAKYFPKLTQIRTAGQTIPFTASGGNGIMYPYEARSGFTPVRIHVYLVDLNGNGIGGIFAIGRRDLIMSRSFPLLSMATTISFSGASGPASNSPARPSPSLPSLPPTAASPLANTWTQRLSDKKLVQFSGYSSGGGSGGYNSEKKLFLASDGSYAFRSSSSVSVYVPGGSGSSAGQNADGGRWRVVEERGQAILELISRNGARERIELSANGSQTLLNGRRWFVVGINE